MEDQVENIQKILLGDFDQNLIPPLSKIVRIFTSSTFTDTELERNILMQKVYPKLKEYCQSHGYEFQVVDMRWGVRDEAGVDHKTTELCLNEIEACQLLSTGPNFITFLGQKYGYRPFPPRIIADDFEAMYNSITDETDKQLLSKWFCLDDNNIPSEYILRSITDYIPNYNDESLPKAERREIQKKWWDDFERMQVILRNAASLTLSSEKALKFVISVTEDEIVNGILSVSHPEKHCYWFKRNISISEKDTNNIDVGKFIDKVWKNDISYVDDEAQMLLEDLKSNKILNSLPKNRISNYSLNWKSGKGFDIESEEFKKYLNDFCDEFEEKLKQMINDGIAVRSSKDIEDSLIREICQHSKTCFEKTKHFHGQSETLESIAEYLTNSSNKPLVVYGQSGCGKTSIIAQASKLAQSKHPDQALIIRFLGTTSESSTLTRLLYSICCQMNRINEESSNDIPKNGKDVINHFQNKIENMRDKNVPIILFIDSIDQLTSEDGSYAMGWLPKELPKNLKVIISALPDEKYGIIENLKVLQGFPDHCFIEVPTLSEDDAGQILSNWLTDRNRKLTSEQREVALNSLSKCPTPLFLKLLYEQVRQWRSFTANFNESLQDSTDEAINTFFEKLERSHGKILVSHALGLLTASKQGLSDTEIDNILSIDDDVLNDVYQYWTPPLRRIPPLLWLRIRADLGSYIVSRDANGTIVNMWYHRQFFETAEQRYLSGENKEKYHQILVEYFEGKWGATVKPFKDKNGIEDAMDRLVPMQPNTFKGDKRLIFNNRKLVEIPNHLICSSQLKKLKNMVLFNFEFLMDKLKALGFFSLIEDFVEAQSAYPDDEEIKRLLFTLKISRHTLTHDYNQLPFQLVGRLQKYEKSSRNIRALLDGARASNTPSVYPLVQCLPSVLESTLQIFTGHVYMIFHFTVFDEERKIISGGYTGNLRLWDMQKSVELRQYKNPLLPDVHQVFIYNNNSCILTVAVNFKHYKDSRYDFRSEGNFILCQSLRTEQVICVHYVNNPEVRKYCCGMSKDLEYFVIITKLAISIFNCEHRNVVLHNEISLTVENSDSLRLSLGRSQFAYSVDGKEIVIRDIYDSNVIKNKVPVEDVLHLAFSPNENKLVLLAKDSAKKSTDADILTLQVYSCSNWDLIVQFQCKGGVAARTPFVVCNLKCGLSALYLNGASLHLWNLENGHNKRALIGAKFHFAVVNENKIACISVQGEDIVIHDINKMEFEDMATADPKGTFLALGYARRRRGLKLSVDKKFAILAEKDGTISLWDVTTQSILKKIKLSNYRILGVTRPNENSQIILTDVKSIIHFDCNTCQVRWRMNNREIWKCILLKESKQFVVYDNSNNSLMFLDENTGECNQTIPNIVLPRKGSEIIRNTSGNLIIVNDTTLLLVIDTVNYKEVNVIPDAGTKKHITFVGENVVVFAVKVKKNNSEGEMLRFWNVRKNELIKELITDEAESERGIVFSSLKFVQSTGHLYAFYLSCGTFTSKIDVHVVSKWEVVARVSIGFGYPKSLTTSDDGKLLSVFWWKSGERYTYFETLSLYDVSDVDIKGFSSISTVVLELKQIVPEARETLVHELVNNNQSYVTDAYLTDELCFFNLCGVKTEKHSKKIEEMVVEISH